ncbi:phenylalanine--tRNA ligase subunit alpha [Desulfonatronovibrio hydrogenovorans]|uniref:phenylalanine--tRNA ligase subunit alpha n=1 Tax=Desulfonatronovibrio hydrogenovorans TaxID=53245 RepID=UPI00048ACFE6|nr:phenylalanine--tRNA ligase subunit alpha [Desulfonatronovibrio hydrogenovorans]
MNSAAEISKSLKSLVQEFEKALDQASLLQEVEEVRVAFLGRKGRLAEIMSSLPSLPVEERPGIGRLANEVKAELNRILDEKSRDIQNRLRHEDMSSFDHTMPGRIPDSGSFHPVTRVINDICRIFVGLGFDIVTGPEVETDFYNFEALNLPPGHPARDMQDTLYISESVVLRTHTSPLQVRTMLKARPPLAAIAPGKVYRRDSDLTHTPMFHQIEGFLVDTDVSMADLRGTLTAFAHEIFDPQVKVRFRPSFFPFTEPSAEVDISCVMCMGSGRSDQGGPCRVCKETGWVEILGCGMIDPAVFEKVGYDPEKYTGFAFGLGVERVAMLKYGIGDLRMFFENDLRFLNQFV